MRAGCCLLIVVGLVSCKSTSDDKDQPAPAGELPAGPQPEIPKPVADDVSKLEEQPTQPVTTDSPLAGTWQGFCLRFDRVDNFGVRYGVRLPADISIGKKVAMFAQVYTSAQCQQTERQWRETRHYTVERFAPRPGSDRGYEIDLRVDDVIVRINNNPQALEVWQQCDGTVRNEDEFSVLGEVCAGQVFERPNEALLQILALVEGNTDQLQLGNFGGPVTGSGERLRPRTFAAGPYLRQ